jgi:hypothetical protein
MNTFITAFGHGKKLESSRRAAILLIAMTSMMGTRLVSPVMAQEHPRSEAGTSRHEGLLPPRVDRLGVRATLLYWGMPAADVERMMGAPAQVEAYDGASGNVRVLSYSAEPIATKVSICDGKVSSVVLDIAGVDERALPAYSRLAWRGMNRATVLSMLGAPAGDRTLDGFGMTLEHMIFERAGQPDVSVFLVGGRVVTKKVGRNLPPDILNLALPLAPDRTNAEIDAESVATEGRLRVGMTTGQVRALYGAPKLLVASTFKGRPVEHSLFETDAGKSFGSFTFIGGVLTEFAITTGLPLSAILWGG